MPGTSRPRRGTDLRQPRNRQRFERALELYLAYCYRERTVARVSELALFVEANRPSFSRAFADATGEPLGRALRRKQLERAAYLLRLTTLTVDEVAAASAFGHRSSFFRAFREAFGMTPERYRCEATKCD